jgi:hypothetical protein
MAQRTTPRTADPAKLPAIEYRAERAAWYGAHPAEQAKWLLAFKKEDLGDFRPSNEVLALGKQAGRVFGLGRDLQSGEVRHVHEETRKGLEALGQGREWHVTPTMKPTATLLPPPHRGRMRPGGAVLLYGDSAWPIDRFLLQAVRVLEAVGDRLRRCVVDGCEEIFLASKRQELCEPHAKERLKSRIAAVAKRRLEERAEIRKRRERGRARRAASKKIPRGRLAKVRRRAR